MALVVKNSPANPMQETQERRVRSLGGEDPLEEGMAIHSRTLAWQTPWIEEPGGLQSTGSKESDTTKATACMHTRRRFTFCCFTHSINVSISAHCQDTH